MKACLQCVTGISLLCLVFAMDSTSDKAAATSKIFLECARAIGMNPDTIMLVKRGKWPEENQKLFLWVHCVLVQSEIMTDKGVFRLEVALRGLPEFEAATAYDNIIKCLRPNDDLLPEELSWAFAKCFQKEDPDHSLF